MLPIFFVSYSTAFSMILHTMAVPIVALSTAVVRKNNESRMRLANGWLYILFFHAVRVSSKSFTLKIVRLFICIALAVWLYGSCCTPSSPPDGLENICSSFTLRATFCRVQFIRDCYIFISFSGNDVNIFCFYLIQYEQTVQNVFFLNYSN